MIIRNARVLTFDSANRVLDSGAVEILPDVSIGQVKDAPAGQSGALRFGNLPVLTDLRPSLCASPTPQKGN